MKSKYPKLAPDKIESLSMCEVFVFGSNLQGHHTGGAARYAYKHFGAEWGVGIGPTGQCYAIPPICRRLCKICEISSAKPISSNQDRMWNSRILR